MAYRVRAATRRTCGTARATSPWCRPPAARRRPLTDSARPERPRAAVLRRRAQRVLPARGRRQPARGPRAASTAAPPSASCGRARHPALRPRPGGRDWSCSRAPPGVRPRCRVARDGQLTRITHGQRRVPQGHHARRGPALQGEERRRHDGRRLRDAAAGLPARHEGAGDPPHSRRARRRSSPPAFELGVADSSRRRATPSSRPTRAVRRATARRSAARSGPSGASRTSRTCMAAVDHVVGDGHCRSRTPRRRRLELRRHPHRLRRSRRPRGSRRPHRARASRTCWPATAPTTTNTSTRSNSGCPGRRETPG